MYVAVSPHYDDAIGSCGCFLFDQIQNGNSCRIITVFGGTEKQPLSDFAKELHDLWEVNNCSEIRRQENNNACNSLGVKAINYSYEDAIYRSDRGVHLYKDSKAIFGEIMPSDNGIVDQLVQQLMEYDKNTTIFLFPIGKGHHVDHIITHMAGIHLIDHGYSVLFYEDFSYDEDTSIGEKYILKKYVSSKISLEQKIKAFSFYSSQLAMLFQNISVSDYFSEINTEGNNVIENFYEIKRE